MTHTTPCECGEPAGDHTIDNGMHHVPVCDRCWRDPENIAVEVCVATAVHALAERLPHDVPFTHLATTSVIVMSDAIEASLAARGIAHTPEIATLVVARWNEWYAT